MDPVVLFYHIDEFYKVYAEEMKKRGLPGKKSLAGRKSAMTPAEIITLRIMFHESGYKTFKDFFTREEQALLSSYFPNLVSYSRCVELCEELAMAMMIMAKCFCLAQSDGISYIDSTKLEVCNIKRASSHKTCANLATKGHTSIGWFFGFKLHLVTNAFGEIVDFDITSGNVADNNESLIRRITRNVMGKLFGDKGYLLNAKLFADLVKRGLTVITKVRSNMKQRLMTIEEKAALSKRGISETVFGILKEGLSLEHSRHRSPQALFAHIAATIMAYFFRPNKPSIRFSNVLLSA